MEKLVDELLDFIDESPCSYFTIENAKKLLKENSFVENNLSEDLKLEAGAKGFVINNDSAIIAYRIADKIDENTFFKIVGSHSDSPGFRIKTKPVMKNENIIKLNTEVYGGPIIYTWFDKPLSLAGRVSTKSENPLKPQVNLLNIDKDLLIIPSLAIHMNREVNKGFEFNPQIHTLPIMMLDNNEKIDSDALLKLIAEELNVNPSDIIDYDLYLYDRQKGSKLGVNNEFISVGRQDNLTMAFTSLKALVDTKPKSGINITIITDNEEVGSRTIQGADSPFIVNTLERISLALGFNREKFLQMQEKSFMLSADLAHAVHPNFTEKADPTNRPKMGEGIVIKYAANKSYTSDGYSAAVVKSLCENKKIKYQEFFNRSDKSGGSTIGPITSSHLNVRACDVGSPILSMHSVRELGSAEDVENAYGLFSAMYER